MHLREALAVNAAADIDPTRSILLGNIELGAEAAAEAIRILEGGEFSREVEVRTRPTDDPMYWAVSHRAGGTAEFFAFPIATERGLPTAIEVALVRALAATPSENHAVLLGGGVEVASGPAAAREHFQKILSVVAAPMDGTSLLYGGANQAIIDEHIDDLLSGLSLKCLANSFRTSPIKFRFLELYRVMEARFLAEIRKKLLGRFDAEPGAALGEAVDALKSEMAQIVGLAETQQDAFEACWTALAAIKDTNRFAAALFRRVDAKKVSGPKWKTGAALVYQIRCAVVHAGEKDMIFENFPDGDDAIRDVLPPVERAALLLVGVELV